MLGEEGLDDEVLMELLEEYGHEEDGYSYEDWLQYYGVDDN